jgi:hypothetical protein
MSRTLRKFEFSFAHKLGLKRVVLVHATTPEIGEMLAWLRLGPGLYWTLTGQQEITA